MAGLKSVPMIEHAGAPNRKRVVRPGLVARASFAGALTIAGTGVWAGTILVTDGNVTAAPDTCTLAQAIYEANHANNPGDLAHPYGTTPAGATTIDPLRYSATSDGAIAGATAVSNCAGASSGANTIVFASALGGTTLSYATVDNYWYGPNALPPIASDVTIDGGTAGVTLDNTNITRLRFFFVGADANGTATPGYNTPGAGKLTLRRLVLSNGRQLGGSGTGGGAGMGGAIFNQGTLTLDSVTLSGNQAVGGAGSVSCGGGGGMGSDCTASAGGGMGGPVPAGTGEPGSNASLGGAIGGGSDTGLAGDAGSGVGGGDGGGGGGDDCSPSLGGGGGGGGFGGGSGGNAGGAGGNGGGFGSGGHAAGSFNGGGGGGGVGGGGGSGGGCAVAGSVHGGGGGFGGSGGGFSGFGAGSGLGGAVFNHFGVVTLVNTTMTGNVAGPNQGGGALYNLNGTVTIRSSTLDANTATDGGAVYSLAYNGPDPFGSTTAVMTITDSILANSTTGHDFVVDQPANTGDGSNLATSSAAYVDNNIVMSTARKGNAASPIGGAITSAPNLGVLADNAGPTPTMLPQPGSPAINTVACTNAAPTDQRGMIRPDPASSNSPAPCDIGAVEVGSIADELFKDGFEG